VLHRHAAAQQLPPVHLVHGVVSVAVVLKLHKGIAILDQAVPQPAIVAEEPIKILLAAI